MGYWDTHPVVENQPVPLSIFIPEFRTAYGVFIGNDGQPMTFPLNSDYFATHGTALFIAQKYGTGQVFEVPYEGTGGPFTASANTYCFKTQNGRLTNAGLIAAYYSRNPEDKFPGLAQKLIISILGSGN